MPVTLHLGSTPLRTHAASRLPQWRRLHAIADLIYPELHALWKTVFEDLRQGIDIDQLEAALRAGSLLRVEAAIAPAWHLAEAEVRATLPLLVRSAVAQAGAVVLAALPATLTVGVSVRFNVVSPEALQWIEGFVGTQVVGIGETTRLAIRQLVRTQFTAGTPITEVMRLLTAQVGLTPRQAQAVEALRLRLVAEGASPGSVARQVGAAARKALALRVETIARTESLAAANGGQQLAWEQAERQGLLDRERFRRTWLVSRDERLCPQCRPVPGLNPQGVALDQPFQTPLGPVMSPPLHPSCRCAVSGRVLPA